MNDKMIYLENVAIPNEEWKMVDYVDVSSGVQVCDPDLYVSSEGRVCSFRSSGPKFVKSQHQNAGYCIVRVNKKVMTLHRIIANLFLTPVQGKTEVDHINKDKDDNRVSNLRWVTRGENMRGKRKRNMKQIIIDGSLGIPTRNNEKSHKKCVYVYDYSGKLLAKYSSISVAAKETLSAYQQISKCINGEKMAYRGVIWLDNENIEERLQLMYDNNFKERNKTEKSYCIDAFVSSKDSATNLF